MEDAGDKKLIRILRLIRRETGLLESVLAD